MPAQSTPPAFGSQPSDSTSSQCEPCARNQLRAVASSGVACACAAPSGSAACGSRRRSSQRLVGSRRRATSRSACSSGRCSHTQSVTAQLHGCRRRKGAPRRAAVVCTLARRATASRLEAAARALPVVAAERSICARPPTVQPCGNRARAMGFMGRTFWHVVVDRGEARLARSARSKARAVSVRVPGHLAHGRDGRRRCGWRRRAVRCRHGAGLADDGVRAAANRLRIATRVIAAVR